MKTPFAPSRVTLDNRFPLELEDAVALDSVVVVALTSTLLTLVVSLPIVGTPNEVSRRCEVAARPLNGPFSAFPTLLFVLCTSAVDPV